jgi:hypothetical protein
VGTGAVVGREEKLFNQPICQPNDHAIDQSIKQAISQPIEKSIDQSIHQSINQPTNHSVNRTNKEFYLLQQVVGLSVEINW